MCNVMIDIETLGTSKDAVIISIAAIEFDPFKIMDQSRTFHKNIDINSCLQAGLKIDGETLEWWLNDQKVEVLRSLIENKNSLGETLFEFKVWLNSLDELENPKVWGNGPSFDMAILSTAYAKFGWQTPWLYRNERCVRTITDLFPHEAYGVNNRTAHNPFNDCLRQIEKVQIAYSNLNLASL